jgi:predicted MFS family arabinose efflux permease
VFFVNVPIVTAALVLVIALVPTSRDPRGLPLDVPGAALSIVTLGALLYGIIEGPERGWTDPLTLAGFGIALLGLIGFLVWERHTDTPMLDLHFFRNPGFSVGTATIAMTFFAMFGMFFVLTQYLQFVRGYSPLAAGVRTLPMMVAMVFAAPASARWAARFGNKVVLSTGLALVALGLGILASLGTATSYWVLAVGLVILGIGMGNVAAPATGSVMTSLPLAKAGVGSAVNDTAREVGGALGIAVLGSLVAAGYRSNLDGAVTDLTSTSLSVADESVSAALREAGNLGGGAGAALAEAARAAYTDAMGVALLVAAGVALLTIVVVQRYLPSRRATAPQQETAQAAEPDADAVAIAQP